MTQENNSPHLPAVPADGKCLVCSCAEFVLAKDSTTYTDSITFLGGSPDTTDARDSTQQSEMEEAVRFFCGRCGARYAVPTELA